jgi:purine-nucleoside phosphorylase
MSDRLPEYFQLQRYNITAEDVARLYLRCDSDVIKPKVIVTPVWKADVFEIHADSITTVSEGVVYEIEYRGQAVTLIRSGIGAPQTGDFVLALGCTPCRSIIFTGSVGGLHPSMDIGDLILGEKSICGDGFSRYLGAEVKTQDCFFQAVEPDLEMTDVIKNHALRVCQKNFIPLHCGTIFSTDSIIAQFFRLDYLVRNFNCIGIEMETSSVFGAAKLVGIRASAILQVSDVIPKSKSLFSGRTKEDMERRTFIRERILAKVILDSIISDST